MAIDNIRLPVEVEQGATGGPRFKTSIQTALSGIEQRIAEWDIARCEYDVGYDQAVARPAGACLSVSLQGLE
jgi:uncharacterized protein (TIGR02217 family)